MADNTRRLKPDEFVPYAPSNKGKVRHNHDSDYCPGSSKSMIIERKDDGDISAYCFRCDRRGYSMGSKSKISRIKIGEPRDTSTTPMREPNRNEVSPRSLQLVQELHQWDTEGIAWLYKYGFTDREIANAGVTFSRRYRRVCFKVGDTYLLRKVHKHDQIKCKWLMLGDKKPLACWNNNSPLVLVEDYLSYLTVCRAGHSALCLFGTHLQTYMYKVLDYFDTYIVWLDDDNIQVKLKQVKLRNKLAKYGKCDILKTDKDPKEYSSEQIQEFIGGL